ncbi:hypothetical protein GOP47_0029469, partial [Adiantum capillus-veneris]
PTNADLEALLSHTSSPSRLLPSEGFDGVGFDFFHFVGGKIDHGVESCLELAK